MRVACMFMFAQSNKCCQTANDKGAATHDASSNCMATAGVADFRRAAQRLTHMLRPTSNSSTHRALQFMVEASPRTQEYLKHLSSKTFACDAWVSHFGSYRQALLNDEIDSIYVDNSGVNVGNHQVNRLSSVTRARFEGGQVRIKPRRLAAG